MLEIRPKSRENGTTSPSLCSINGGGTRDNVGQAIAALGESRVAREIIGGKNAKRYSGKRECDSKGGFGRSRIDNLIAIEERQGRRSARWLRRRVPVQR